mgnify:CR=1 FL=1
MKNSNDDMKKLNTAIYIRLSREDGDGEESDSVVNQRTILRNYVETNDGIYSGICSVYSLDDLETPLWVYSLRNKVQGFCVTDNGTIVLSTSQSFYSSEYYIYNKENIRKSEKEYVYEEENNKSLPLYILDNPSNVIKGTCMSEDLSYYNGKVFTLTESACNKYILGKFFFAFDIFSLEIE